MSADNIVANVVLRAELVNLYHLAQTAIQSNARYERMCWAAKEFGKAHNLPAIRAYKALDRALVHEPIDIGDRTVTHTDDGR